MFKLFHKKVLYKNIEDYVSWKEKRYPTSAHTDRHYLMHFARISSAEDVSEIRVDDVLKFTEDELKYSSRYISKEARKSVKCLIRYYRARRLYVVDERIFKM